MRPSFVLPTTTGILATAALLFLPLLAASAQSSAQPQTVHSIYVAPLTDTGAANALRQRLIDRLKKSGNIRIVDDARSADAVLHSNAVIWPTGNISINPRSNSAILKNYQGYLSAELSNPSNQPLWSYLVTPSRFRMDNIVDDLADQLSARLIAAVGSGLAAAAAPTPAKPTAGISLHAAGATFPGPLYELWFRSFASEPNAVPIAYDSIGSSAGLQQLASGAIDLAASDIPTQGDPSADLHIPTVVGGIVPIYNLPGESQELNLTPQLLAAIFSGKIRKWNDPALRESNRNLHLPNADIAVIHRSDGSGTTYVFTSYLAQQSPDWKPLVGASIAWPIGTGAAGNEGVAQAVARTPNSISYTELTYAIQHQMAYAAVQNPAGRFVRAGLASIAAAVASHTHTGDDDLRSSALNVPAKDAYPITTFTWFLVPKSIPNRQKRAAIQNFLHWMLTTGQKQCSALGYAPLPPEIVHEELAAVDAMK